MNAVIPPAREIDAYSLYVLILGDRFYCRTSQTGALLTAWSPAGACVFKGSQAPVMREIRDMANLKGRDCRIVRLALAEVAQ